MQTRKSSKKSKQRKRSSEKQKIPKFTLFFFLLLPKLSRNYVTVTLILGTRDLSKTEWTNKGEKKHQESDKHLCISLTWDTTCICSPSLIESCWEQPYFVPKMSVTPYRFFGDWEQQEHINRATQSSSTLGMQIDDDIKLLWSHFTWATQNNILHALISSKTKKQKQHQKKPKQTKKTQKNRRKQEGGYSRNTGEKKLKNYSFALMKVRKRLEEKKLIEIGAWLLWGFELCVLHTRYKKFPA